MKFAEKNLLTVILAAGLAPALSAAPQGIELDLTLDSNIPALENILTDSRMAASASDHGSMRGAAMRSFDGLFSKKPGAAPAVQGPSAVDSYKETSAAPMPETIAVENRKNAPSTVKTGKPGLSSQVPSLSKGSKEDSGNIAAIVEKGLEYAAVTLVAGGAVVGALLLGTLGIAVGMAAGAVVLGVVAAIGLCISLP